jgi:hypothetical protein
MKTLFFTVILFYLNSLSHQDNVESPDEVDENWEKKMYDYEPGYVYMIPVKSKKSETFYEEISKVPVKIKGAYLTDENIKDKIEFIVVDPNNKMVYKNFTNECIFEFEAKIAGTYKVKFRNSQSKHELKVTFTMNTYQEEILQKDHFNFTDEKINTLGKFMDKIRFEEGVISKKRKERKFSKCFFV